MNQANDPTTTSFVEDHIFRVLGVSAIGLIAAGTTVYKLLEGWSWVDSLYFSVVAVTTVGFGDLTPSTDVSKLFTVVYIISGITIVTTFLHARMSRRSQRYATEKGLS